MWRKIGRFLPENAPSGGRYDTNYGRNETGHGWLAALAHAPCRLPVALRVSPSMGARDGVPLGAGRGGLRRLRSVRPEEPGRHRGRGPGQGWPHLVGVRGTVRACRGRQPAVAHRRLVRGLYLRCSHRRHTARSVRPPLRPLAELLLRAAAGCAGEPHHRYVQRRVHHREHRLVERAATLRGGGLLDHLHRLCEPDDGGRAGGRRDRAGRDGVLPRAPRDAAASQLCQQGGRGRWRVGRRDRQHGRGARVRRDVPRTAAHRGHDRRGDGRAPRQPDLSGAAAADPCRHHRDADRRRRGLGDPAVAAGSGDGRRPRADHHAVVRHPALHARPGGGAWSI